MSFKPGDYLVYTEEKIDKISKIIKKNAIGIHIYNSQIQKIDGLRNHLYIFIDYQGNKERFSAKVNGKIYNGLIINDFRLATLKEKRKYDLSQIYNK
jgi:hypothetical protein